MVHMKLLGGNSTKSTDFPSKLLNDLRSQVPSAWKVQSDAEDMAARTWKHLPTLTRLQPAKCQPTCRIFVIFRLAMQVYGGFAPKPPKVFLQR